MAFSSPLLTREATRVIPLKQYLPGAYTKLETPRVSLLFQL